MLGKKRKIIIISSVSLASIIALSLVLWLFFPVILRAISPTWYTQYAFSRTGRALSAEFAEINDFFNFPDFSDSDVMQLTVDSSNHFANIDYGGLLSPGINLSKLNIGVDMLYDRSTKQASIDLHTGWDDKSFLITLYTNVRQIALGFNDNISWAVNADSIGKYLAGLGLPVDEELTLDLGLLFPDIIAQEKMEDVLVIVQDFFKSLKFSKNEDADYFIHDHGTVMTALICGNEFKNLVYDIVESYYGSSKTGDEIRQSIANLNTADHELTVHICNRHYIQAARVTVNTDTDSTVILTAQGFGPRILDHNLLEIKIGNDYNYNLYSLESKGQHVPVDDRIIGTTTISGFDTGEIQMSYDIEKDRSLSITAQIGQAAFDARGVLNVDDDKIDVNLHMCNIEMEFHQLGTVYLSGGLNITFGKASNEIRDITAGAHNIADFEIVELYPLLQIILDIITQNDVLIDIFGTQLNELILTTLFGEQFASYIIDILGGNAEDLLNLLNSLLDGRTDSILDLLVGFFSDRLFDGLGDLLGGDFIDSIIGQLGDILSNLLENGLPDNLSDLLGDFGNFFSDSLGDSISDWFSGLFNPPHNDD